MFLKKGPIDRELISGVIIFISLFSILLSMAGIKLFDVKVTNIELIDRGLYSVITDNGPVNIAKDDIMRIEKTYTKTALTGSPVEFDKIYTTKGFIYISSTDPYYSIAKQLMNSVDFENKTDSKQDHKNKGFEVFDQSVNGSLKLVKPFSYAIGLSAKEAGIVSSILSIQYVMLALGGFALMVLIFPLRLETSFHNRSMPVAEPEYYSDDEQFDAVAK
ncbi:hypothetical protein Desor_3258 [Desulfosporosinus orientis DSM 765]|uniref:Uncharacterized protein n=1 Tax=Desulfosporosinus orientis (strain ATCC 19365 / DSM 765 / NCIMB 8382 / VKM B-1628 / Singapore I) TaxID=768706 RepID=G7WBK3_DESOD|nr:hypothetical protein [Desulfosporosinus orientis]AET68761.1 hypothetical protein Desor_3258 [Desulfosporosinus orientis DSM 765]